MRKYLRAPGAAGILALALGACSVTLSDPVWVRAPLAQDAVPADTAEKLKVDDVVRVSLKGQGQVDEYKILRVDATGFVGKGADDQSHTVEYSTLGKMWVRRWQSYVERTN